MKKIDIDKWKEFQIDTLFQISRPSSRSIKKYDDGDVPFVSSGNFNNGVDSYKKPLDNDVLDKGNCITVSPVDGSNFYQEIDFLGRGGGGSSIILLYNDNLNKMNGLFLASVINKTLKRLYEYNDMGSSESIKKEKIKLPVKENGNPNWEYMENFIKRLYSRERESTSDVSRYLKQSKPIKIDVKNWKRFHLYDENLFEIFPGTKLDKKNMTTLNPNINFVGRSNLNNGIAEEVDYINGIEPYKKGNLTLALGGYLGSCFIQPKEFYTSQNVIVLKPKLNISYYCKLFLSIIIFKESQTYYKAFNDELNRHIKTDFSILLPIDKNEKPDWNYMNEYIKKMYEKEKKEKLKLENKVKKLK